MFFNVFLWFLYGVWLFLIAFDCFQMFFDAPRPKKTTCGSSRMARPKDPALDGNHSIFNSQYFACLPPFNFYIHTICSLWTIKATKVHHPTIYNTSRHTLPQKKIINLWTQKKSYKKCVPVLNKCETAIFSGPFLG